MSEVARIPGRPLAASNAAHFANLLSMLKSVPLYQEHGATWVDGNVVPLAFNAGFCANELKEFALGVRYLKVGVEASPFEFGMRLELAHAMTSTGKVIKLWRRWAYMREEVRERTKIVDLKQVNRVLLQPHWRQEQELN